MSNLKKCMDQMDSPMSPLLNNKIGIDRKFASCQCVKYVHVGITGLYFEDVFQTVYFKTILITVIKLTSY